MDTTMPQPFDYEQIVFRPDRLPVEKIHPVLSTGWRELDPYWRVQRGQFVLVAGKPNRGKTAWLTQLAVQLADLHQWRIGILDFEARLGRTRQRLMERRGSGERGSGLWRCALGTRSGT